MKDKTIRESSDDATGSARRATAERTDMAFDRWATGSIPKRARNTWPEEFLRLGGSLPDAPTAHAIHAREVPDVLRTPLI